MRVNLIHNSGAGSQKQPDAEALQHLIKSAGHQVIYQSADAVDLAAALDVPCDIVAVAGGDGTAGRIAKKLVGRDIPLAFLPVGTANNISKSFGLVELPLERLIDGWNARCSRWIDVGVIGSQWGSHYFIEGVGMGLFVRTMMEIDRFDALGHLERAEEKITHAMHLLGKKLERFPTQRFELSLDGKNLSGEYLMLEVMNMRFVGPNLYIAPASDPSDGFLDVVLLTEAEREALREHLSHWKQGILKSPMFPTHRVRELRIEDYQGVLHVDDEAWPRDEQQQRLRPSPIEISARPRAIEILIPPSQAGDIAALCRAFQDGGAVG